VAPEEAPAPPAVSPEAEPPAPAGEVETDVKDA